MNVFKEASKAETKLKHLDDSHCEKIAAVIRDTGVKLDKILRPLDERVVAALANQGVVVKLAEGLYALPRRAECVIEEDAGPGLQEATSSYPSQ